MPQNSNPNYPTSSLAIHSRVALRFVTLAIFAGMVGLFWFGESDLLSGAKPDVTVDYPETPIIAEASAEGEQAISTFNLPAGFKMKLFAAEPHLAHPVSICFDPQGRCYVAETFRQDRNRGVEDNRNHMDWLDEDLAAQTVADRRAYLIRHRGDQIKGYTQHDDRIRRLEDTDKDGVIDQATVFADHFNDIVDGSGAGLLFQNGSLYYTNIPKLWKLEDTNDDGVADQRNALHEGYGVRTAFRGHDLHGLTMGPDGMIYFSIGDRGFNVSTKEGTLANPETGAVFRCLPDGSQLEVFASGLRNPQELAFDAYGNLFTVDNNSDSGDKARLVQVVQGGDSGWRMAYQYLSDRGPWNREKLWHPRHEGQPAYIIPPLANMANGPSGLVYNPGTGMPKQYDGHFFLCEFRGGATKSGIISFAVEPDGATFQLKDEQQFLWSILATDIDFAPSGEMVIADWVHGWLGENKGRLYKLWQPAALAEPAAQEAAKLLQSDFQKKNKRELANLLAHPNMRVRLAAQFALVDKNFNSTGELGKVAISSDNLFARLHAIWGLGQTARDVKWPGKLGDELGKFLGDLAAEILVALLGDENAEVRAQAARMLGEAKAKQKGDKLIPLLKDESPRVQSQTALALGQIGTTEAVKPLFEMLAENDNADAVLRHAGVMGLAGTATVEELGWAINQESAAVRLAAVLALRRKESGAVRRFLRDSDSQVVEEAARAIHDVPIPIALPDLADLIRLPKFSSEELIRRVLNANFRLGTEANAKAVAQFATRTNVPEAMRLEGLSMLADWSLPSSKDRVLNMWRPLASRPAEFSQDALRAALPGLFTSSEAVRTMAAETAAKLGLKEVRPELQKLFAEKSRPAAARVAAFWALVGLDGELPEPLVKAAMADDQPAVRAAGLVLAAKTHPKMAFGLLEEALESGTQAERQAAFAALQELDEKEVSPTAVNNLLAGWVEKLIAGEVADEIQLDLILAAQQRKDADLDRKLATYKAGLPQDDFLLAYRPALAGGDALRGEAIFFERSQLSCMRCHTVGERGGIVGPELTRIGTEKKRDYLLEAIVAPNKTIAKGFQSETILLDDGRIVGGVIKDETDQILRLMTPQGRLVTLDKETIEDRKSAKSPMPEDFAKHTTLSDLRDLVEYLSSLKKKQD